MIYGNDFLINSWRKGTSAANSFLSAGHCHGTQSTREEAGEPTDSFQKLPKEELNTGPNRSVGLMLSLLAVPHVLYSHGQSRWRRGNENIQTQAWGKKPNPGNTRLGGVSSTGSRWVDITGLGFCVQQARNSKGRRTAGCRGE